MFGQDGTREDEKSHFPCFSRIPILPVPWSPMLFAVGVDAGAAVPFVVGPGLYLWPCRASRFSFAVFSRDFLTVSLRAEALPVPRRVRPGPRRVRGACGRVDGEQYADAVMGYCIAGGSE